MLSTFGSRKAGRKSDAQFFRGGTLRQEMIIEEDDDKLVDKQACKVSLPFTKIVEGDASEDMGSDSNALDSDEENCELVNNDNKDLNFECQQQSISDYRQNKLEDYMQFHGLPGIPVGLTTTDPVVL